MNYYAFKIYYLTHIYFIDCKYLSDISFYHEKDDELNTLQIKSVLQTWWAL